MLHLCRIVARMLIQPPQESNARGPTAQTANGDGIMRAHSLTSSTRPRYQVATPRAQALVARRGFSQVLPLDNIYIGLLSPGASSVALVGRYVAWHCLLPRCTFSLLRSCGKNSRSEDLIPVARCGY